MANGWAKDGAVQDQIDASIADEVERARGEIHSGPSARHCEACDATIPEARRRAVPGVKLCIKCQEIADCETQRFSVYNRRGSKDSQLR